MKLNAAETDALVRNLDGLTDLFGDGYTVYLSRRDSFDNRHRDGFVVLRVTLADGSWWEDAFSDVGSTTMWATSDH